MSGLWKQFEQEIGSYSGYLTAGAFDYATNISLKYKYIYVETPKVACSTVKSILHKMELEDPGFHRKEFKDIHNRNFSPLLKPSQVGSFEKLLGGSMFTFCFTRNPYTRLLSVYLEKICGNMPPKREALMHLGRDASQIDQEITFDEFVGIVCEQPVANMNPHWRIQYHQTFQSTLNYDFVGKLEAFPSDLHFALGRINEDFETYLTDERRHSQGSNDRLREFYTPSLARKVKERFLEDFEHFGYPEDVEIANDAIPPTVPG